MTQPDIFDEEAPWCEWLPELRMILDAYSYVPVEDRFTDSDEGPSLAMRTYLRMATFYPGRAFRVSREIVDVLSCGLDEVDVASNVASMPPITPPPGRSREECLAAMLPHLAAFVEGGERAEFVVPETGWEWGEYLPNLSNLMGAYFHQDALEPTGEIIDDYVAEDHGHVTAATADEIRQLLALGLDEDAMEQASSLLGSCILPDEGLTHAEWFSSIADRLSAHLKSVDYEPPAGRNPAYPPHDIRSVAHLGGRGPGIRREGAE